LRYGFFREFIIIIGQVKHAYLLPR